MLSDISGGAAGASAAVALPFAPRHARAFAYRDRLLVVSTHDEAPVLRIAVLDLSSEMAP